MTQKRYLFLTLILSLAIVTLMTFSLTYARYSEETESDGMISGNLEYIVSNEIEIDSVNEFFSAIENGYTNIKISDDVDNPLVITGSVSDVNSDLTIDLNGHELQRNNRDPVLNVTNGVRLTIIDTKGGGSFYNPVGSVLRISGGTLTVADGIFESGPRDGYGTDVETVNNIRFDSEYATQVSGTWSTPAGASIDGTNGVTYYENNGSIYTDGSSASMPIILPNVSTETDGEGEVNRRVNGNMYFAVGQDPVFSETHDISDDTYLYYTLEGDNVENTDMAATDKSADFYYTYYVSEDTENNGSISYNYAGVNQNADGSLYLVTVYGYYGVKGGAATAAGQNDDFAAIQMNSGNLFVRGGRFTTYFGESYTYCVRATGGYMSVTQGGFEAMEKSICVGIEYSEDVDTNTEYLNVSQGTFYSEVGDTIEVSGGRMNVGGGSFTKDVTQASSAIRTGSDHNGAAIDMHGGELTVTGTADSLISFDLIGSYLYGIRSADGSATLTNVDIEIVGGSVTPTANFGVYVTNDLMLYGNCRVNVTGTSSSCIYAHGGAINYTSQGTNDLLSATMSGSISSDDRITSAAISAVAGSISITGGASVFSDGLGITTSTGTDASASGSGGKFTYTARTADDALTVTSTHGTAMYIDGNATITGTATITSQALNDTQYTFVEVDKDTPPIYDALRLNNGGLTTSGNFTVNHTGLGAAVYIKSGSFTAESGTVDITNNMTEFEYTASAGNISYDGVYVGGSLDASAATFNVKHIGVVSDGVLTNYFNTYQNYSIRSFAVRVENGDITIYKGTIENEIGGGIYVHGSGDVTLGQQGSDDSNLVVKVTAVDGGTSDPIVYNSFVEDTTSLVDQWAQNWRYKLNRKGGPAVEIDGGYLRVNSGSFSTTQGDGIIVRGGNALIVDGYFKGNDAYIGYVADGYNGEKAGPGASYSLKVYAGTVDIYGGTFGLSSSTDTLRSTGSGAFIMGMAANDIGTANIYGGSFDVDGQGGISVYQFANVLFEENRENPDNSSIVGEEIYVQGAGGGLIIEYTPYSNSPTITIESGTFYGNGTGSNGLWTGNPGAQLYINGGVFGRSRQATNGFYSYSGGGLMFGFRNYGRYTFEGSGRVQITKGEFYGTPNDYRYSLGSDPRDFYSVGAIGGGTTASHGPLGWTNYYDDVTVRMNEIIVSDSTITGSTSSSTGSGSTVNLSSDYICTTTASYHWLRIE